MRKETNHARMRLNLPPEFVRAIRLRATIDACDPRDVVMAAVARHLAKEPAQARRRGDRTSGAR